MLQSIRKFITWWNRPNKSVIADYIQTLIVIVPLAFLIRTCGYGLYRVPSGSMETTMLIGEMFFADKFTYMFVKPKRGDIVTVNEPMYPYSKNPVKRWIENYVWGPQNWTKRVIGIPGDHIEGKIEDGKTVVYRNGEKLDEPYLNKYPLVPTGKYNQDSGEWRSYDSAYSYQDQPFYQMNGLLVRQRQLVCLQQGMAPAKMPGTPMDEMAVGSDIYDIQLQENQYWLMGDNRLGSHDSRAWGVLDGNLIHGKIVFRIFSLDTTAGWLILDLLQHPIAFWSKFRWSRCLQMVS